MTKKQVGRKTIGDKPMTAPERKSRQREALKASGGKTFSIDVKGEYMRWIRAGAEASGMKESEVLRGIVESAIIRFAEVTKQADVIIINGGTGEQLSRFLNDNAFPPITNPLDYLNKEDHHDNISILK